MAETPVGARVGAIMDSEDGVVNFIGYGKYVGFQPTKLGFENPKIELDNGKVVYGVQCWWGPEAEIKELLAAATKVNNVEIEDDDLSVIKEESNGISEKS
jgi:hypothetical protein